MFINLLTAEQKQEKSFRGEIERFLDRGEYLSDIKPYCVKGHAPPQK